MCACVFVFGGGGWIQHLKLDCEQLLTDAAPVDGMRTFTLKKSMSVAASVRVT